MSATENKWSSAFGKAAATLLCAIILLLLLGAAMRAWTWAWR